MPTLYIDEEIVRLFPHLRIGIVSYRGLDNTGMSAYLLSLQEEVAAGVRERIARDELLSMPEIESWRQAYRAFGTKPNKHKPTLEAMMVRLLQDKPFPRISKAVDAYLVVQTRHLMPIGGYETDKLRGDVTLRRSPGGEAFSPLGAREPETTRDGEVVYADAERVLTRHWNHRDSDDTKITESSHNVVLLMEAVAEQIATARVRRAVADLAETVVRFCGGDATTHICDVSGGQRNLVF